jgi:Protein of unknown function (DUF3606)
MPCAFAKASAALAHLRRRTISRGAVRFKGCHIVLLLAKNENHSSARVIKETGAHADERTHRDAARGCERPARALARRTTRPAVGSYMWLVFYWTKTLGVTKNKLQDTIEKVGNSAKAVRKELGLES